MKPEPLCSCTGGRLMSNWLKKSSMLPEGGRRLLRAVRGAVREASIATTAGVSASATFTNALLASAIGFDSFAVGLTAVPPPCWAYPKRVQFMEDANRSPQRKAMTTAPPRRSRELVEDIRDVSVMVVTRYTSGPRRKFRPDTRAATRRSCGMTLASRWAYCFVTYKCRRGSLYG